jgi:hypothetical protein
MHTHNMAITSCHCHVCTVDACGELLLSSLLLLTAYSPVVFDQFHVRTSLSLHYDTWLIPSPGTLATSTTFSGRWIGRVDGIDRASTRHFAKKAPNFLEINPHSEERVRSSPRRPHTEVLQPDSDGRGRDDSCCSSTRPARP